MTARELDGFGRQQRQPEVLLRRYGRLAGVSGAKQGSGIQ
jgi:hypothetical protein